MTMRISDRYERFTDRVTTSKAGAAGATSGADKSVTKTAAVTAPQPSVLSVKVSAEAAQLSAGSARLEELKQSVRNGTFKVDARAIANTLVGDDV
jgi:anti-sigma28 factor (negative regulator of flagellin synthesis)